MFNYLLAISRKDKCPVVVFVAARHYVTPHNILVDSIVYIYRQGRFCLPYDLCDLPASEAVNFSHYLKKQTRD